MSSIIKVTEDGIQINSITLRSVSDIRAYIATIYQTSDLSTQLGIHKPEHIYAHFRIIQTSYSDLFTTIGGHYSDYALLNASLYGFRFKDIYASIGGHQPAYLFSHFQIWHESYLQAQIDMHSPENLLANIYGDPYGGINLLSSFRILQSKTLQVNLNAWTKFKDLFISCMGWRKLDLITELEASGGYKNLNVNLPLQSQWVNLYATFRINLRRISTIIKVHMLEHKELYAIINNSFPCYFGSSYKNLYVEFSSRPDYLLLAYLRGIRGTGTKDLRIYINHDDSFSYYLDTKKLNIIIPLRKEYVVDFKRLKYNNLMSSVYLDYKTISFIYPRRQITGGYSTLYVGLSPYENKTRDLYVELFPLYQLPPILKNVSQVELWSNDPPELYRIIDILFEQQVHEYIWSGYEQVAYSRALWEKWCLMSRGYLPSTLNGGQIDYVTMQSLCDIRQFANTDEAIRYLIEKTVITGTSDLYAYISMLTGCKNLQINFSIISNLQDLVITLEPVHTKDLSVNLVGI